MLSGNKSAKIRMPIVASRLVAFKDSESVTCELSVLVSPVVKDIPISGALHLVAVRIDALET